MAGSEVDNVDSIEIMAGSEVDNVDSIGLNSSNQSINYQASDVNSWSQLVFLTESEAYEFYKSYAKSMGFLIRKSNVWRNSKNEKTVFPNYLNLMCHKQGYKTNNNAGGVSKKRNDTRTGCLAVMRLKMDSHKGGYVITKWLDDHNHELIDVDKRHLLARNISITEYQKLIISNHLASGISQRSTYDSMSRAAGGVENLDFLRKDLKNHLDLIKQKALKPGEATVLQTWFRQQALSLPGFYYDIQVDNEESICSIFWADPVMRADYALFGDFVSFDTTYRTNKEYRPLGIFVSFNHHKGTCVFGGALLYDETIPSFKWLFETFSKCMNGKKLVTFMTDQAPAIAAAVRDTFSMTFHALCSWHIKQSATKKLDARANAKLFDEFKHLVKHVDNEEQFEYSWKHMIQECFSTGHGSDINWLNFIYTSRKQWSSAWVKNTFTAGKKTTQLSEQFNAFARFYLKPEHSIVQLLSRFQDLLDDLRHNELMVYFRMQHNVVQNRHLNVPIMRHASTLFTPSIFEIIQKEFDASKGYTILAIHEAKSGSMDVLQVEKWDNQFTENEVLVESEVVKIDSVNSSITYSCRFFENWWLICRHSLRVLDAFAAWRNPFCFQIPSMYVKNRWCRDYKKTFGSISRERQDQTSAPSNFGNRYQRLFDVVHVAGSRICYNEAAFNVFLRYVVDGVKEAEKVLHSVSNNVEPSRAECASLPSILLEDESFSAKRIKHRPNPIKSKTRLMSESEKRHLIWKQQRK